jgi:hypothetical protein
MKSNYLNAPFPSYFRAFALFFFLYFTTVPSPTTLSATLEANPPYFIAAQQSSGCAQGLQEKAALFVENKGQWADDSLRFAMRRPGANLLMYDDGVAIQLLKRNDEDLQSATIKMRFIGANEIRPAGIECSESVFHYYLGPKEQWQSNVPSFYRVVYRNLYDGIDLRVTGKRTGIKFEFIVAPGADWRQISVGYDCIEGLAIRDDGSLEIRLGEGWTPLVDGAPYIYQEIEGRHHAVEGLFALVDSRTWRFEISEDFDPTRELIIDPELEWSTYLGGTDWDLGEAIAVDGSGNIVVIGTTSSSGWVSGGFDTTYNGGEWDAFVAKLSPSGVHLWSTYLGGSDYDRGWAIAVDGSDNIVVTGYTRSSGWVSGGFDTTYNGGYWDAFVAKLSSSGAHLWSTYLGGISDDDGYGIAVDGSGNIVVTGTTSSTGWVSGGFDTTYNGGDYDAFVAKLNPSGAHLWSTYLGGSRYDVGHWIAVDGSGNIMVSGSTTSSGWVSGGFDTTHNGSNDAFVAKLSPQGEHLWSTYLGGTDSDLAFGIAVDGSGNIVVTGWTRSSGWVSGGFDTTYNGGDRDAFVVKLSTSGAHLWSTYLGGSDYDRCWGIAVDSSCKIIVTGTTRSSGWVSGGFDTTYNGLDDAFVAKLSTSGAHLWSTYLGGSDVDYGWGIAVDGSGNIVVAGSTDSIGWVSGGFDTIFNGPWDGFVAKIQEGFPWPIVFDFVSDEEAWTTGGAAAVFTLPDFAWEPDFLTVTSQTNTNTFGFWQSPQDAVPADSDYLYRARFSVSTDLTDKRLIPQIRLRANSLNLQQYDVLSIESAGDGAASPDPAGTDYDLYFAPPANYTSVMLAFDLLNFNPFDAPVAEIALDTVTVDRFALDSLSTPTLVQDYTFELSTDGWTTGGAPTAFSPPEYIHAAGALELRALTNTNTFGYWVSDPADITIEADKLYRGTFEVRTDVTNPALIPEMRLRFNAGNFQASSMLGIVSSGDGANSPGTTNTTYDRLYFLPPASCVGEGLIVSFDILNFNPDDASEASFILDRAIIETLLVPALP